MILRLAFKDFTVNKESCFLCKLHTIPFKIICSKNWEMIKKYFKFASAKGNIQLCLYVHMYTKAIYSLKAKKWFGISLYVLYRKKTKDIFMLPYHRKWDDLNKGKLEGKILMVNFWKR